MNNEVTVMNDNPTKMTLEDMLCNVSITISGKLTENYSDISSQLKHFVG